MSAKDPALDDRWFRGARMENELQCYQKAVQRAVPNSNAHERGSNNLGLILDESEVLKLGFRKGTDWADNGDLAGLSRVSRPSEEIGGNVLCAH